MAFDMVKPQYTEIEKKPGCIQAALNILGDKWSPLILGLLFEEDKTFGELELMLAGISPRTLSSRLDKLEAAKIIRREQYCQHPPRYRYCLTEKGRDLRSILVQMGDWGAKYHDN